MTHEIKNSEKYIQIRYSNFDSLIERYYVTDELIRRCKNTGISKILVDVRNYDIHLEPIDFLVIMFELENIKLEGKRKFAVVLSDSCKNYRWANLSMEPLDWNIRYFFDDASAIDWLSTE